MNKSSLTQNGAEKAGEAVLQQAILPFSNLDPSPSTPALAASKPETSQRLAQLEQIIAAGRQTFYDVGNALLEIRDSELYKPRYRSFEEYCLDKWGFGRSQAYRLMDAAEKLSPNGEIPVGDILKESHARALLAVPQEKRESVLKAADQAAKSAGRRLTARDISEAADSSATTVKGLRQKLSKPKAPVTPKSESVAEQLYALWLKATPAERRKFLARVQAESAAEPREDHEPYACSECGATCADLQEAVTLYECEECGETFTQETSANHNHQCPTYNRFGSKLAENGCPECNLGVLEREAETTKPTSKERSTRL